MLRILRKSAAVLFATNGQVANKDPWESCSFPSGIS
jgi:hypothetical protein